MAISALSQHFVNPSEIPAFTWNKVKWDFKTLALTILSFGVYYLYASMEPMKKREVEVIQTHELDLTPHAKKAGYEFDSEALLKALAPMGIISLENDALGVASTGSVAVVNTQEHGKLVIKIIDKESPQLNQFQITENREGGDALALSLGSIPGIAHTKAIVIRDQFGNYKLITNYKQLSRPENRNSSVVATLSEFVEGKELFEFRHGAHHLTIKRTLKRVAEQLREMHQRGIIHRDLSYSNILIGNQVAIIDFGFAKNYRKHRRNTVIGNPGIVSPEVVLRQGQNDKVDTWALGADLCLLKFGALPFHQERDYRFYQAEFREYQKRGSNFMDFINSRINDPDILPVRRDHYIYVLKEMRKLEASDSKEDRDIFDLINKLLTAKPKDRLDADGILRHPYLAN